MIKTSPQCNFCCLIYFFVLSIGILFSIGTKSIAKRRGEASHSLMAAHTAMQMDQGTEKHHV